MSERFKPEISVVRPYTSRGAWWLPDDGAYPEERRAILVRGVPMVGERVMWGGSEVEVAGYRIHLAMATGHRGLVVINATEVSPAPDEDEAMVERVARAIAKEVEPSLGWEQVADSHEAFKREARAAIRAMKGAA